MSQGYETKAVIKQGDFKQYTPREQLMALLFESDEVIRDKVEHSVFGGSANEGLSET